MKNIVVIGGGASGMTAAIYAARNGASVTLLEQNDALGKKILATGNGRCNLTNLVMTSECYRGDRPEFAGRVLESFGVKETMEFFESLGVRTVCKGNYVYPFSCQAASVRDALAMELKTSGVQVVTGSHVNEVRKNRKGFQITSEAGDRYYADKVILASGSKASEIAGSDGSGYGLAKSLGHSLSPIVPALVQLRSKEKVFKKLSGIRIQAEVIALIENRAVAKDQGEVQLTDYGVSGIPIFQISRYVTKALYDKKKVSVRIDFFPEMEEEELLQEILNRKSRWGKRTAEELLNTLFPAKMIPVLLGEVGIGKTVWAEKISEVQWRRFVVRCKNFVTEIAASNPVEKAQICAGGVRTEEMDPGSMESRIISGVYITGELLDIDGICGGYNLQFAWSTGALAGMHAAGE